jgi:hypothetical protein
VKFAGSQKLSEALDLSATLNVIGSDVGRAWRPEISVSVEGQSQGRFGGFAEFDDTCEDEGCGASVDGGLTVGGKNRQLDVEAGFGFHGPAPEWFVGAGFVLRIRAR